MTGKELHTRRTALGITQTELGKRSRVPRSDICRVERGRGDLGPQTRARVTAALDRLEAKQRQAELERQRIEAYAELGEKLALVVHSSRLAGDSGQRNAKT